MALPYKVGIQYTVKDENGNLLKTLPDETEVSDFLEWESNVQDLSVDQFSGNVVVHWEILNSKLKGKLEFDLHASSSCDEISENKKRNLLDDLQSIIQEDFQGMVSNGISYNSIGLVKTISGTHVVSYDGTFEVGYQVVGDEFYVVMSAKTLGWVALGLTHYAGDNLVAYCDSWTTFITNDTVYVRDEYIQDAVSAPELDTERGGKNDIIVLGGYQDHGWTTIYFKRKINTGDVNDVVFDDKVKYLVWAHAPGYEKPGVPMHDHSGKIEISLDSNSLISTRDFRPGHLLLTLIATAIAAWGVVRIIRYFVKQHESRRVRRSRSTSSIVNVDPNHAHHLYINNDVSQDEDLTIDDMVHQLPLPPDNHLPCGVVFKPGFYSGNSHVTRGNINDVNSEDFDSEQPPKFDEEDPVVDEERVQDDDDTDEEKLPSPKVVIMPPSPLKKYFPSPINTPTSVIKSYFNNSSSSSSSSSPNVSYSPITVQRLQSSPPKPRKVAIIKASSMTTTTMVPSSLTPTNSAMSIQSPTVKSSPPSSESGSASEKEVERSETGELIALPPTPKTSSPQLVEVPPTVVDRSPSSVQQRKNASPKKQHQQQQQPSPTKLRKSSPQSPTKVPKQSKSSSDIIEAVTPVKRIKEVNLPTSPGLNGLRPKEASFFLTCHALFNYRIRGSHISVAQVVYFICFLILNAFCFVVIALSREDGMRVGDVSKNLISLLGANTVLSVTLATRNSIWIYLLGIPFDVMITAHRWVSRWMILLSVAHVAMVVSMLGRAHVPIGTIVHLATDAGGPTFNVYGFIAFLACLIILITSIDIIRRRRYEIFVLSHYILVLTYFIFGCIHNKEHFVVYTIISAIFYGIDLIIRVLCGTFPMKPDLVRMKSGVVQLQLSKMFPSLQKSRVGQYVFINVPSISMSEWHPFSVTSAPHQKEVEVHIKPLGNWTNQLAKLVTEGQTFRVRMDGPYGNLNLNYRRYQQVLLVGGGIGVTPIIGLLKDIYYNPKRVQTRNKKVIVVWTVRTEEEAGWFYDDLETMYNLSLKNHELPELDLRIHITGAVSASFSS
eukprot:TRINITY_DN1106_c0_g1_i2.p1 TRINITY_DN1106_c0_g1~~TRINITY_DN1106_c0_g1_i2.p1  ORF type:complete len:1142 (+),score=315.87 TRINITY_DN1106_c0_g1_i2:257-3427(+)